VIRTLPRGPAFALAWCALIWWIASGEPAYCGTITTSRLAQSPRGSASATAPTETLLVEVRLEGIGAVLVLAESRDDSEVLVLPAAPIFKLVGLREPPVAYMTLEQLRGRLGVAVVWQPRQLALTLLDPNQILPASRARLDRPRATAEGQSGLLFPQGLRGPLFGLTRDDRGATFLDLGYSVGWATLRASRSSVSGRAWQVYVTPLDRVQLSYSEAEHRQRYADVRLALGHTWAAIVYQQPNVEVSGATVMGPLVVFGSTENRYVFTWRGPNTLNVQLGHSGDRSAVSVSFGPLAPSPLMIPGVR